MDMPHNIHGQRTKKARKNAAKKKMAGAYNHKATSKTKKKKGKG